MDWFMLTAMVIAGWAILSGLAGERSVRQHNLAAAAAATAAAAAAKTKRKAKPAAQPAPRLAA